MKLTKKAKVFLKETAQFIPLISKECSVCKHHNPNHLSLIQDEKNEYIILCSYCKNPEKIKEKEDAETKVETKVETEAETKVEEIEKTEPKKTRVKKEKSIKKPRKSKKATALQETWVDNTRIYSDSVK